jgi:D-alanyl-D-alanine carboxypeptidase/D-alanyl-D-alanine-endopeptidase (penicillin-binding protein 4)
MRNSPYAQVFIRSLPTAGKEGTLAKRFGHLPENSSFVAKTGGLSGVSNIAGYMKTSSGKNLLVAFFINGSLKTRQETWHEMDEFLMKYFNF